jgi:hypothetical protein
MSAGQLLARQFHTKYFQMWKNWALFFCVTFFTWMQIRFLVFDALTEEFHTFFLQKTFTFYIFLKFVSGKNFQMWKNWRLVFATFFRFHANRVFEN